MYEELWMQIVLSLIVVWLLVMSAFYSFSEMALASSNKARLNTILKNSKTEKRKTKIKKVIEFSQNYNESITSIVVFNNIINVLATTLATSVLTSIFSGGLGFILSFILMTTLIIIFGELLPKMLAKKNPEKGLINFYPALYVTKMTLTPITFVLKRMTKQDKGASVKSVPELKEIIDEVSKFKHITVSEHKLLQKSLVFSETKVKTKMIPLKEMIVISPRTKLTMVFSKIKKYQFTRFPIISNKKIVGVLNTKTLLIDVQTNGKINPKKLIKDNIFKINSFISNEYLSDVFTKLRSSRQHMGAVVSPKGVLLGFITVEDIVESIVGQMYDETEYQKDDIYQITDTSYQIKPNALASTFFTEYLNRKVPSSIKKSTTFKEFIQTINSELNPEKIIYKNFIIWVEKDKIKKETTYEVDIIKNGN